MIQDRARDLGEKIKRLKEKKETENVFNALEQRLRELKKSTEDLARPIEFIRALKDKAQSGRRSADGQAFSVSADIVRKFKEQFEGDDTLFDQGSAYRDLKQWLQSKQKDVEDNAESCWRNYWRTSGIVLPSDAILDILSRILPGKKEIDQIRQLRTAIQKYQDNRFLAVDILADYETRGDQLQKKWKTYVAKGSLSDEIIAFLSESGSGGADVHMLTSSVIKWIDQYNLSGLFKVYAK
jgi:hypothetical protein